MRTSQNFTRNSGFPSKASELTGHPFLANLSVEELQGLTDLYYRQLEHKLDGLKVFPNESPLVALATEAGRKLARDQAAPSLES